MREKLNREWASLHSGESLIRYRLTRASESADVDSARVYLAALDSIEVVETDDGFEFTTHLMLPVPDGWVLARV